MYIAEDNLHQVRALSVTGHSQVKQGINQDQILKNLLNHIEIRYNFDCTDVILDIVNIMAGQHSAINQKFIASKLAISDNVQNEVVFKVTSCVSRLYLKAFPFEIRELHR